MKIIDVNGNERECTKAVPDPKFPGYMKVNYKSKTRKDHSHTEWYPIIEFVKNNPQLKKLAKDSAIPPQEILGVVSRGGKDFLRDKKQNLVGDAYVGMPLWISRGKGEGQVRKVMSNSHDTIYIGKDWKEIPDKTSQYVVSYNIVKNPKPMGNQLPWVETDKNLKKLKKTKK